MLARGSPLVSKLLLMLGKENTPEEAFLGVEYPGMLRREFVRGRLVDDLTPIGTGLD